MAFQPFLIGDFRAGLRENLEPWKIPGEAFQIAENVDMRDGVISRRLGYKRFASFTSLGSTVYDITLSGTDPVVVTTDGDHGLSDGDEVIFRSVVGTTELNGSRYTIYDKTATTFKLSGTNSGNFTVHTQGSGRVYLVSKNPITGFVLHRDSNDNEDLIVGDTVNLGSWDSTNSRFDHLEVEMGDINNITAADPPVATTAANHNLSNGDVVRVTVSAGMTEIDDNVYIVANKTATTFELQGETAGTKTYTGGAATGKVYLINHFSGTATNKLSWVNYKGAVYIANGKDQSLKYDGSTLSRVVADFSGGSTNDMNSAKHLFVYKDRLIALSTIESGTTLNKRARFSVPGDADDWHDQNNGGTGGFIDAPTGDPIVSAAFLQDNLIVFFRKSVWMLRYTGNAILPFRWELISSTRKIEAAFGTAKFDKFLTAIGSTGILACNGSSIDRLDLAIPDFARQFNTNLIPQFFSYKFEEVERVLTSYADVLEEDIQHALVYHFEDEGWTTYDLANRTNITGITQADPAVVTTEEAHNLTDGDRITIDNVSGMTEVNDNTYIVANSTSTTFELEGVDSSGFTAYSSGGEVIRTFGISVLGEYQETSDDVTWSAVNEEWNEYHRAWNDGRFQIGAAVPLMGDQTGDIWELYRGGADRAVDTGSDVTGHNFTSTLKTKRFNPFISEGTNCELGYVDLLFSRDSTATVDVQFFIDAETDAYEIDGSDTITLDLTREFGSSDRVVKRIYPGATGAWHEMQMSTSGQDQYVDLHAMIFWFRPAGRVELHA